MRGQTARDQRRKRGMKRETNEGWDEEKEREMEERREE